MSQYASVAEYFAKEFGGLVQMLDNPTDFWSGVSNNTITTAELQKTLELYRKKNLTGSLVCQAANAILDGRSGGKIETLIFAVCLCQGPHQCRLTIEVPAHVIQAIHDSGLVYIVDECQNGSSQGDVLVGRREGYHLYRPLDTSRV